ncbi:hypothetical protein TSOC_012582 [Tetrabaena socialis]|uniref:EVE domain-containing protein n=1 Tax=Tetrabaena socialis TaxID=47790 RepID=A0A2J7ZMM6_9CHLO|nr:hypothetical protein TSOC_012582 [Tetrabaena socialis]|eukprot:PNH01518.1 hypothetical protein TSOC_012582 [Tetrabaena socialis]
MTEEPLGGGGLRFVAMGREWPLRPGAAAETLVRGPRPSAEAGPGVRNAQARNIMRSMKLGEEALFYHSPTSLFPLPNPTCLEPRRPQHPRLKAFGQDVYQQQQQQQH